MTEEKQITEKGSTQTDLHSTVSDTLKSRDKKEKCRPMTKVVIRRLPPTMTQEQFIEQVSPLPEHDYIYFAKADMSLGQFAFSRAYINFVDQQDIFVFRDKFDNYVFLDSKGNEYPAVVEFSPFQKLPRKRARKTVDLKCGSIESDPYYISFLESLKSQDSESGSSQPKTEYSYQPSDNSQKKVTTTPLLDFLKQRKQEKQRIKEEKREVRRRRRLKEEPMMSQVLKSPVADKESRENKENHKDKEKIILKENKNRLKKEDKFKDKIRDREIKLPSKLYKERDKDTKYPKKEDKKFPNKRDEKDTLKNEDKNDVKVEKYFENKDDSRDRNIEGKKGKSYEKMRQEKKRLADAKKQVAEGTSNIDSNSETVETETDNKSMDCKHSDSNKDMKLENIDKTSENLSTDVETEPVADVEKNVSQIETSLENLNLDNDRLSTFSKEVGTLEYEKSKSNEDINKTNESCDSNTTREAKIVKRRNSLESGGESSTSDGSFLRRHKSLDGGDQSNFQKTENDTNKDKKDPRLERRIRNKDRPAMEIYRPGMGKFSKQRLEREKSNNDNRASLSQSPTPSSGNSNNVKTNKSGSEVRSMTFKRSFNRENS